MYFIRPFVAFSDGLKSVIIWPNGVFLSTKSLFFYFCFHFLNFGIFGNFKKSYFFQRSHGIRIFSWDWVSQEKPPLLIFNIKLTIDTIFARLNFDFAIFRETFVKLWQAEKWVRLKWWKICHKKSSSNAKLDFGVIW